MRPILLGLLFKIVSATILTAPPLWVAGRMMVTTDQDVLGYVLGRTTLSNVVGGVEHSLDAVRVVFGRVIEEGHKLAH